MVQLIKKGGLRERANRSRSYQGSENTETTLKPNRYQNPVESQQNIHVTDNAYSSPSIESLQIKDEQTNSSK